jgi:hypothetical protein
MLCKAPGNKRIGTELWRKFISTTCSAIEEVDLRRQSSYSATIKTINLGEECLENVLRSKRDSLRLKSKHMINPTTSSSSLALENLAYDLPSLFGERNGGKRRNITDRYRYLSNMSYMFRNGVSLLCFLGI